MKNCVILKEKGEYALLMRSIPESKIKPKEFIVAWCLNKSKQADDELSWEQGHYFGDDIYSAVGCFIEKTAHETEDRVNLTQLSDCILQKLGVYPKKEED